VAKALELGEPSKTLSGAVLSPDGRVAGTFAGPDGEQAVRLLRTVITNQ
jgi:hypothetical protein